jgi:hypothetical protein
MCVQLTASRAMRKTLVQLFGFALEIMDGAYGTVNSLLVDKLKAPTPSAACTI